MNETAGSGLEVKPSTRPEVVPQSNEDMYYIGGGAQNDAVFDQSNQSDQSYQPQANNQGRSRAIWMLGIITVVCLAAAIGAGLGAGLAAQRKSTSSSSSSVTAIQAISASVTTPQPITQANSAPVSITLSADLSTITPTPTTLPSPSCPAANGSTYVATYKPQETPDPLGKWEISSSSLSFEIFCNTNFCQKGTVLDIQMIENITSLNDCLDQCAFYNFRVPKYNFPALGCTGTAWIWTELICWLKRNVILGSSNCLMNGTLQLPDADGAVLLGI